MGILSRAQTAISSGVHDPTAPDRRADCSFAVTCNMDERRDDGSPDLGPDRARRVASGGEKGRDLGGGFFGQQRITLRFDMGDAFEKPGSTP